MIGNFNAVPLRIKVSASFLLAIFFVQAYIGAKRDSVTIDEFEHLPVGLYALHTNDFSMDPINPPLLGMIAAIPLLIVEPEFPYQTYNDPGHWGLGYLFMKHNVESYHDFFIYGRVMVILLAVVLGWLVFLWACRFYGWQAGIIALFLFSFSPSMLAHSHLVTLDLAGALGFTASMVATWLLLERPIYKRAILVGITMGIATLMKLSGVVLITAVFGSVIIRVIFERAKDDCPTIKNWLGLLVTVTVACLLVVNAGYFFQGVFLPLGQANFIQGGLLSSIAERLHFLGLPLPLPFLEGIDKVLNIGKGREPSYFFAGELSSEGWWYYHIAAFAFKTPLPLLILSAISLVLWVFRRSSGKRDYCLFMPIILLFASNALFNSMYIGVRHILPVYPLLFISVSPLLRAGLSGLFVRRNNFLGIAKGILSVIFLAWFIYGSLAVAPRYVQYFNEVAGGPYRGHKLLIDSNVDWGQDLIRLREYMDEKVYEYVNLAYFGRVHPAIYDIPFVPIEGAKVQGPVVISASFLMGRPYFWYKGGRMQWIPANTYNWLQEHEPVDRVGAMFVYNLTAKKEMKDF